MTNILYYFIFNDANAKYGFIADNKYFRNSLREAVQCGWGAVTLPAGKTCDTDGARGET